MKGEFLSLESAEKLVQLRVKNIHEFQDIVMAALRYALGRKTMIVVTVATFIKEYPEIIDKRVKRVMLNDLEQYFNMRDNGYSVDDECDYDTWKDLKEWLKKIETYN